MILGLSSTCRNRQDYCIQGTRKEESRGPSIQKLPSRGHGVSLLKSQPGHILATCFTSLNFSFFMPPPPLLFLNVISAPSMGLKLTTQRSRVGCPYQLSQPGTLVLGPFLQDECQDSLSVAGEEPSTVPGTQEALAQCWLPFLSTTCLGLPPETASFGNEASSPASPLSSLSGPTRDQGLAARGQLPLFRGSRDLLDHRLQVQSPSPQQAGQ